MGHVGAQIRLPPAYHDRLSGPLIPGAAPAPARGTPPIASRTCASCDRFVVRSTKIISRCATSWLLESTTGILRSAEADPRDGVPDELEMTSETATRLSAATRLWRRSCTAWNRNGSRPLRFSWMAREWHSVGGRLLCFDHALGRKDEPGCSADTLTAVDPQCPAMHFDEVLCDRQA